MLCSPTIPGGVPFFLVCAFAFVLALEIFYELDSLAILTEKITGIMSKDGNGSTHVGWNEPDPKPDSSNPTQPRNQYRAQNQPRCQ